MQLLQGQAGEGAGVPAAQHLWSEHGMETRHPPIDRESARRCRPWRGSDRDSRRRKRDAGMLLCRRRCRWNPDEVAEWRDQERLPYTRDGGVAEDRITDV